MAVGVYAFFDSDGDCLYVGQSAKLEDRKQQHINHLRGGYHKRTEFNDWFAANGESNLIFSILEECADTDDLKNALEIKYFETLSPKFYGQVPSMNNKFTPSEATRKKISDTTRKVNEAAGAYIHKTCVCGTQFTVCAGRQYKYCSKLCANFQRRSALDFDTISSLYNSGLTLSKVGARLNVSYRTVHNFMVKNNIPRRASGYRA